MIIYLYHKASGAITGVIETAGDPSVHETANIGVYTQPIDPILQYVISPNLPPGNRELVTTIELPPTAVVGETVTATGLPSPCFLLYNGKAHEIIGGSISTVAEEGELVLELVGRYINPPLQCVVKSEIDNGLSNNVFWQQLAIATPAQIGNWVNNNINTLADAKLLFKTIMLGLRKLHDRTK